nr:hypothetical protein [Tanacetum cinerariifolium]
LLCFGGCMMVVLEVDDGVRWLCDGLNSFCVVSFRYVSKEDEDDGVRWRLWLEEEEHGYSGCGCRFKTQHYLIMPQKDCSSQVLNMLDNDGDVADIKSASCTYVLD